MPLLIHSSLVDAKQTHDAYTLSYDSPPRWPSLLPSSVAHAYARESAETCLVMSSVTIFAVAKAAAK